GERRSVQPRGPVMYRDGGGGGLDVGDGVDRRLLRVRVRGGQRAGGVQLGGELFLRANGEPAAGQPRRLRSVSARLRERACECDVPGAERGLAVRDEDALDWQFEQRVHARGEPRAVDAGVVEPAFRAYANAVVRSDEAVAGDE